MAYESDPVFQKPQWLIKTDEDGKLMVVEDVLDQISKISKPLNIVAIVGPSRTGKSYLLNRLAQRSKVSSTSTAVAKMLTPSTTSDVTTSTLASTSETSTTSSAVEIYIRKTTSSFASTGTQQTTITSATSATSATTFIPSQTSTSSSSTTTSAPGFQLGSTTEAVTKGIWVWCRAHPIRKDEVLMLLDTEGIGDVKKSDSNHDNWIFIITTLLASTLVYNIQGCFNLDTLEKLSLITKMSSHLKTSESKKDDRDFVRYMPTFILIVRDKTLTPSKDGKELTGDEYLHDVLRSSSGEGTSNEEFNLPRKCIRDYFKTKKCFMLERPASLTKDLARLQDNPDKLLPEYVTEENEFMTYVLSDCDPKLLTTGEDVTGSIFVTLTRDYVEAIRNGEVLCIESSLFRMTTTQNTKAVEACVQMYLDNMQKELQLPVSDDTLSDRHDRCAQNAITLFERMAVNDKNREYQNMAYKQFREEYDKIKKRNKNASKTKCKTILENLVKSVDQNITENKYRRTGGYTQYRQDFSDIQLEYNKRVDLGCMKEKTLQKFLTKRLDEDRTILLEDQHVTELEKERELNYLKGEREEMKRSQDEAQQRVDDMKQQLSEQEKQLEKQRKKIEEVEEQRHELLLQAALQEQARMLNESHEKDTKQLQDKNDKLSKLLHRFYNPNHKWFHTRFVGFIYRKLYGDMRDEENENDSIDPKK